MKIIVKDVNSHMERLCKNNDKKHGNSKLSLKHYNTPTPNKVTI